jgi:hypothetical protein
MKVVKIATVVFLVAVGTFAGSTRIRAVRAGCPVGYGLHPNLALDQDGDGYWVGEPATVCVGSAMKGWINGSMYYRDPQGRQYIDITAPNNGKGDCNDSEPEMYRMVQGGEDHDQDGYIDGQASAACVGVQSLVNGRRYYFRRGLGSIWLDARDVLGTDCFDQSPNFFQMRDGLLRDWDHDGYVDASDPAPHSTCVGLPKIFNGRTYYDDAWGFQGQYDWLDPSMSPALGMDANDGDEFVYLILMGGTDKDLDGWVEESKAVPVFAGDTMVASGRTYYKDANGAFTILAVDQILGYGDADDHDPTKH